jgi:hypothetical protein
MAPALALAQSMPAAGFAGPGDSSPAAPRLSSQRIEGLWDEQVTQVDCRSGAPLHPIGRGTNLFIRGGALIATNNAPPTVMGITLGEWRRVGGHGDRFRVRMRLNLFQPPLETFVGFREMTREITLSKHGNSLSGVVAVQDYFPEGSPNGNPFCASETGTRIVSP